MRFEHWFYTVPLRLRSLFQRNRVERELEEEMEFHVERRIRALRRDLVHHRAQDQRDRYPPGAGRHPPGRSGDGAEGMAVAGDCRDRNRRSGDAGSDAPVGP